MVFEIDTIRKYSQLCTFSKFANKQRSSGWGLLGCLLLHVVVFRILLLLLHLHLVLGCQLPPLQFFAQRLVQFVHRKCNWKLLTIKILASNSAWHDIFFKESMCTTTISVSWRLKYFGNVDDWLSSIFVRDTWPMTFTCFPIRSWEHNV